MKELKKKQLDTKMVRDKVSDFSSHITCTAKIPIIGLLNIEIKGGYTGNDLTAKEFYVFVI